MSVLPPHEKSDMVLVGEIPRLFKDRALDEARSLVRDLGFWYHADMNITGQVYWTENHSLMYLSSHILLLELLDDPIPSSLLRRLDIFLSFKAEYGMAEFMSPVYLPFTIASLLNIYDYTRDERMRSLSSILLTRISIELLRLSTDDGSLISPSARSYARHREKTTGHHISLFLEFLLNNGRIDPVGKDPSQALFRTLTTTTFRFSLTNIHHERFSSFSASTSYETLLSSIMTIEDDDIVVTLLWSHGIFIPRQTSLALRVLRFMDAFHLWSHPHFTSLRRARSIMSCLPLSSLACMISSIAYSPSLRPYVRGAYLTDASLTVFKEEDVVLSSIMNGYNAGFPCYQQWPWSVNLAGVPLWCSYGTVGSGGLDNLGNADAARELSTSRVMPRMTQFDCVLHASYTPSYCLLRRPTLQMRWPVDEFDAHGTFKQWKWATRRFGSVAYFIHKDSIVVVVCDTRKHDICSLLLTLDVQPRRRLSWF